MTRTQAPLLIAATMDPLQFVACRQRPWDGLLARWHSLALDAQLAAGAAPDEQRLRQVRARQLLSPRSRRKLATRWDELLDRCAAGTANRKAAAAIPVQQRQIVAAAAHIRRLSLVLRGQRPVSARGAAMAHLLLTDGSGPVYNPASAAHLPHVLCQALDHLEPTSPIQLR